jgi:ribonuclease HII
MTRNRSENPNFQYEQALWAGGAINVAGLDEAGRGALAGPVAAAALVFPADPELGHVLYGVRDSKQMTPAQREYWAERLPALCLSYGVGFASHTEIDTLGILPATRLAAHRALTRLAVPLDHLLLDFLRLPDCTLPQTPLVKGDVRVYSIAAASILAKTARDAWMRQADLEYPGYGFAAHKGYGTAAHRAAMGRLGLSPIHRRSFRLHDAG